MFLNLKKVLAIHIYVFKIIWYYINANYICPVFQCEFNPRPVYSKIFIYRYYAFMEAEWPVHTGLGLSSYIVKMSKIISNRA